MASSQILLFQTTEPENVKKRLLRFREAFLRLGPNYEFAIVSFSPKARTEVRTVVLDNVRINHYVFGQDAIEWAIVTGLVRLTNDLDRDVRESMSRYDEIIEAYRRSLVHAEIEVSKPHAPMQRADPRRRTKTGNPSVKAKHAA